MDKTEAQKRIAELSGIIEYHNNLYYNQDEPEISDFEYDMLLRELENLDRIPESEGGDLYLINGNMTKLKDAGIFAANGKENHEEVLELDESKDSKSGNRRGKH